MAQNENPERNATMNVDGDARWTLVVPAKPAAIGKSRLAPYARELRTDLARAMALDTITAALASPLVAELVAVTDDPESTRVMADLGALVVADEPDGGLNPALVHGARIARDRRPDCAVAALQADLPALRTAELTMALQVAGSHPTAFVADSARIGTALYCASPGAVFAPRFGDGSRQAHLVGGAVELTLDTLASVRQDVDTEADLRAAVALGVGGMTRAVLDRLAQQATPTA